MCYLFFFNDTATTEIYTLSLHDALPILVAAIPGYAFASSHMDAPLITLDDPANTTDVYAFLSRPSSEKYLTTALRSEEHTSELQSRQYLVCRLLLEKKKIHVEMSHSIEL